MLRVLLLLGLVFVLTQECSAVSKVMIICGPSCAGKSTLKRKVKRSLGSSCAVLDYDYFIDERMQQNKKNEGRSIVEKKSLQDFIKKIKQQKKLAIVDINSYIPELTKGLGSAKIFTVLLYTPLDVLLERDQLRTQRLKRPKEREARARHFVFTSFAQFFSSKKFGHQVGTLERKNFIYEKQKDIVFDDPEINKFYEHVLKSRKPSALYPKISADLIYSSNDQFDKILVFTK